jgi:hypothetical protein
LTGFIALWMRQTNVIWVAFAAANHGYNLLTEALKKEQMDLTKIVQATPQILK